MNHGIKGLLSSTPTQHVHNVSAFNISTTRPFAEQELRIPSGPSHNSVNANNNGRYPRNRNYFEDHGARRGSHGLRGGYHSRSSTSYTWQSPEQKHMQDFVIVRNAMRRLFKNSEVSKWKLADYLAHQNAMIASQQHYLNRQLAAKDASSSRSLSSSLDDYSASLRDQVVANLHTEGNASLVLGEKTIWCHDWENGKEEVAEWPTYAEMKWEGDDRAKTAVGRFLPLPREMGAPGIIWSQLQVVDQYPLDQVCRIPTMEDVYAPVDEIEDDVKYYLVSHDLEDAIDEFLES
ncbi:hypothetical protein B0J11DRAFT_443216 [Dendryphion nanum]|uniref:Uncharacterized protein n=1 Tax=Dendryphion nanum TaxID=256645 RepID=A0A9P9DDB0_9PLEO|nr:hypothetical protein B0J11DRAFT_443216 [Dendryphion nanum]